MRLWHLDQRELPIYPTIQEFIRFDIIFNKQIWLCYEIRGYERSFHCNTSKCGHLTLGLRTKVKKINDKDVGSSKMGICLFIGTGVFYSTVKDFDSVL